MNAKLEIVRFDNDIITVSVCQADGTGDPICPSDCLTDGGTTPCGAND